MLAIWIPNFVRSFCFFEMFIHTYTHTHTYIHWIHFAMLKRRQSAQFGLLDALALSVFYRVEYSMSERLFIPKSSILSNPCHFAHVCVCVYVSENICAYHTVCRLEHRHHRHCRHHYQNHRHRYRRIPHFLR